MIEISSEALVDQVDVVGQIQRLQADAYIAEQRAELAAAYGDRIARMMWY